EGDVENIWVIESKHLCLLEGSHASSWGEHEHADAVAPAHGIFRRGAGIPGGSTQDIQGCFAAAKLIFKKLTQQLHGHILASRRGSFGHGTDEQRVTYSSNGNDLHDAEYRVSITTRGDSVEVLCRNIIDTNLKHLCGYFAVAGFIISRYQLPPRH